jgi:hypothetical protein
MPDQTRSTRGQTAPAEGGTTRIQARESLAINRRETAVARAIIALDQLERAGGGDISFQVLQEAREALLNLKLRSELEPELMRSELEPERIMIHPKLLHPKERLRRPATTYEKLRRYFVRRRRMKENERKLRALSRSLEDLAPRYETPVFACKGDFDRCKRIEPSIWCHVTLIVCLLHQLVPRIEARLNL